jgi:hypothetical protein
MVKVDAAASVSDETVIVLPATLSVPALDVEYPAALDVVDGVLQPAGTATLTEPFEMPPAGAVYVKVTVRPVCAAETTLIEAPIVPAPSAAYTVMLGEEAMPVSEPADVDFSCVVQVCAPVVDVAVAPGPPLLVSPYVIVKVDAAASVSEDTVIVLPATLSVPALEVE